MGMFYVFYLNNDCSFSNLKKEVQKMLPDICDKTDTENRLEINCDYFSVSLVEGGTSIKFRSEDYGMPFKFQFRFNIYYSNVSWAHELMVFIGKILKTFDGNCVLESNGDTPIVMRSEKDKIVVVDDKKLKGTQRFPFNGLGLEYQEGNLVQI